MLLRSTGVCFFAMSTDAAAFAAVAPWSTRKGTSVFPRVGSLEADPKLDDLQLLAQYEARIDRENGWDSHNLDTFGEAECNHDALVVAVFGEPDRTDSALANYATARPWYSHSRKAGESGLVITRGDFLVARTQSLQSMESQPQELHGLRTVRKVGPSLLRQAPPLPPPGLELQVQQESFGSDASPEKVKNETRPQKQFVVDLSVPEPELEKQPTAGSSPSEKQATGELSGPEPKPEQYKVLLQNLPETMNKSALRLLLKQAQLEDVAALAVRANGKALITFTTFSSVGLCIKFFHGWWAIPSKPVSAVYVQTVKNLVPQQPVPKVLSAAAPVFVPSSKKVCERASSNASTDSGPSSDEASNSGDSEN